MRTVPGYAYGELLRAVMERDNGKCFGFELLMARRKAKIAEWGGGQATGLDAGCRRDWIPAGLLRCEQPWDSHHWLEKQWLKSYARTLEREWQDESGGKPPEPPDVAGWLNDPRNCSLLCRRHHDLIGNRLVVVRRADLRPEVEEFAAELGDRAVARLERDFGRAPVSPVELRVGG